MLYNPSNKEIVAMKKTVGFSKKIFAVILVSVLIILVAQYYSKKIAMSIAGLILISSLVVNMDKLKEVYK